jgi:undecaprenyl-diphosphatase
MFQASRTLVWLPLYLLLLAGLLRTYRKDFWMPLAGVALALLFTDQITSGLMKPFFERLRPSQEPSLAGIIHLVDDYKGGLYGFASSHAANTFGVAMFFWLLLRNRWRWVSLLFVWAASMTYTRIYLGVHYPGDVLVGAVVGLLGGWLGFGLCRMLQERLERNPARRG